MYICSVVGSFLVSVFSSLLFLCFFFDKGGLIVFITTNMTPNRKLFVYVCVYAFVRHVKDVC